MPLGPLNIGWTARSLPAGDNDNFYKRVNMNENWMSFFMYFVSFVLKKGDIKWYTRKSVFCNQISYGTSIWIYHMEWVSYRARFYEFWLILHVVFLYRIRTDILKLSSFTQKTIWSQKNSTKNILHLRTEIKTLTLHLIFFSNIYRYIKFTRKRFLTCLNCLQTWMNAEVIHYDDCSLGQSMITAYWRPPDWDHLKTL